MSQPIVGIVLAAGSSRRFGSDKLLHPLPDAVPMAVAAVRNLRPACDRLIVVLRPGSEELARWLATEDCETRVCQDASNGMGHSLAAGVSASAEAAGWVVALADMPFISPASHQCIATALRDGGSLAATEFEGKRGHPVGFSRQWFDCLTMLTGDQGGKNILESNGDVLRLVGVDDPGVLRDIDGVDDLMDDALPNASAIHNQQRTRDW